MVMRSRRTVDRLRYGSAMRMLAALAAEQRVPLDVPRAEVRRRIVQEPSGAAHGRVGHVPGLAGRGVVPMSLRSLLTGRDLIVVPARGPFLIARTTRPRHVLAGVHAGSWQVDWSIGIGAHRRPHVVDLGRFGVVRYGRIRTSGDPR